MANTSKRGAGVMLRRAGGIAAAAGCCLMLAGCAQLAGTPADLLALNAEPAKPAVTTTSSTSTASTTTGSTATPATPVDNRAELTKATDYWGKAYAQNPREAQFALNYARNLKAMGEKQQAMAVLQQSVAFNGTHRGLLGEYGRLALEMNQVTLAQKLLEQADDPALPDWKIISARGTVMAKQGLYREAIPLYERALSLAPGQASVMSNLALAYAMEGSPEKAEPLLKRAVAAGGDPRVNQNLALVLGLQGKYDEAKLAAARDLPPDGASANVDYLQSMVQVKAKPLSLAQAEPDKPAGELKGAAAARAGDVSAWSTTVAAAKP